jgi:DNA topoisomerase-1
LSAISVRPGRFGPYVNHGKINATLPKGTDPETLTLEQAVELIKAKAGTIPERPARKAAAKSATPKSATPKSSPAKSSAKKPATKKAPAKKPAAKKAG